ncbi:TP-like protein [Thermus phage YS40_Isch]|nr:TP-like protein [Thermus phage YS40_Isch]
MFSFIKSLFLIFPTIIQVLSLILNLLKAVQSLNNQKPPENVEQKNKNSSEEKESLTQEEVSNKNKIIDKEKLIELENRSFFVIRCKNDFYSLDESLRKLPPDVFKEKYSDFCEKESADISETKNRLKEDAQSRIKQKNVLINKIYFILNKYGLSKDFDALPQEIKELDPEDFKEYAKKNL